MTAVELLKSDAAYGFSEFMKALEGITEKQAWAVLPPVGEEYLHTDGSIHGIVLHCAGVKFMYGSICFRNTEMRWRDLANQIEAFEPSWEAALDYLARSHEYWLASWAHLTDSDLETMVPTNFKQDWPAWKIIRMMSQHDSYHAGQIAVLRYASLESELKPPSCAEDVRTYCRESVHW
jgi:uncharacterized damage-inducible protein DinB